MPINKCLTDKIPKWDKMPNEHVPNRDTETKCLMRQNG